MAGPHRVRREKTILGLGGAALMTSTAAQRRVCFSFGVFAQRVCALAAMGILAAAVAHAGAPQSHSAGIFPSVQSVLFSASLDLNTLQEVIEDHSDRSSFFAEQDPGASQQGGVIERIEFLGNRRIRSD